MADDKRDAPRPFDVRTVEYLLKLMSEHDLAVVDLQEGDQRIRLRKGGAPVFYAPPVAHAPGPPVAHAPAPAAPAGTPGVHTPGSPGAAPPAKNLVEIKSPMVGTFYPKPDPKKPEYVTVGSKVTPKTVVCKLEAMKLFNDITADCTGTVAEVCVKDGDPVEFNQVLFRIDPS